MTVSKAKKSEVLESLTSYVNDAQSIAFTTNMALTVEDVTKFRNAIRPSNAKFVIAKKTLLKKVMKDIHNVEIDDNDFNGQIGVVFSFADPIEGLSSANTAMKPLKDKISWACGFIEGEYKNSEETKAIAGLPTDRKSVV